MISFIIFLFLLLCFDFFQFSALHFMGFVLLLGLVTITPVTLISCNVRSFLKSTKYIWALILLCLGSTFYSATIHYGQGLTDNIIATLYITVSFSSISIFYFLVKLKPNAQKIGALFKWAVFLSIIVFLSAYLFPNFFLFKFSPKETTALETVNPTMNRSLFYFGFFFFIFSYFERNKVKYLFYALFLLLLPFILIKIQRQALIFSLITVFISAIIFYRKNIVVKKLYIQITAFLLIGSLLALASEDIQESLTQFTKKFAVMSNVVSLKETDEDISTSARVGQIIFALDEISQSPIMGVGMIRSASKDQAIGKVYFHVGDIGLIGIYYAFGLAGLLLVISFLKYVIRAKKQILKLAMNKDERILIITLWSYMVYLLFSTIGTGEAIFSIKMTLITVVFLFYMIEQKTKEAYENQ